MMIKLATSVLKNGEIFLHTILFNFEGKNFEVHVVETPEETYVDYCYLMMKESKLIDIPKYFGGFSSEVYDFIYSNIQRGYGE